MIEMTKEQVQEMRARNIRKGKVETPPVLTEEDEHLLDAALKSAQEEVRANVGTLRESDPDPRS